MGFQRGWFSSTQKYHLLFKKADGLNRGANVSFMGLKIGVVTQIDINENSEVEVEIKIQSKYAKHVHKSSQFLMARPFMFGEKEIVLMSAQLDSQLWTEKDKIKGEESLELTDFLSGNHMARFLKSFELVLSQLSEVFEKKHELPTMLSMYSQLSRSLASLELLQKDISKIKSEVLVTDNTKNLIKQLVDSTHSLKDVVEATRETLPAIKNLSEDTREILPQVKDTLDKTAVTLEAMQRSFLFRSGVQEYKKENQQRMPASAP
jgi:ABC-type transporter Mla subunit MlaD